MPTRKSDKVDAATAAAPPPISRPARNADPTRCSYWVEKRNRFCTFQLSATTASMFCGAHQHLDPSFAAASDASNSNNNNGNNKNKQRVKCPFGNHFIVASDIERHKTVCPDARWNVAALPFFHKGLHESFCPRECERNNTHDSGSGSSGGAANSSTSPSGVAATDANAGAPAAVVAAVVVVPVRKDEKVSENRGSHRDLPPEALLEVWQCIVAVFREFVLPTLDMSDPWVCAALHVEQPPAFSSEQYNQKQQQQQQLDAAANQAQYHDQSLTLPATITTTAAGKALTSAKNAIQHEHLIQCLRRIGAISRHPKMAATAAAATTAEENNDTRPVADVIVELGAGKAQFSLAIADACVADAATAAAASASGGVDAKKMTPSIIPHFVVVDRAGFRRKADSRIAHEGAAVTTTTTATSANDHARKNDDNDYEDEKEHNDSTVALRAAVPEAAAAATTLGYRPFQRIRIDMADFDLSKVDLDLAAAAVADQISIGGERDGQRASSRRNNISCALVGKHTCGCCCDFAVSTAFLRGPPSPTTTDESADDATVVLSSSPPRVTSVDFFAVAACCHHRCERRYFEHLLGAAKAVFHSASSSSPSSSMDGGGKQHKEHLEKLERCLAKSKSIFSFIVSLSSWATSACQVGGGTKRRSRSHDGGEEDTKQNNDDDKEEEEENEQFETVVESPITIAQLFGAEKGKEGEGPEAQHVLSIRVPTLPNERERAGRMCKLILDFMRGASLVGSGKFGHFALRPFLSPDRGDVTKENWIILAWK